MSFSLITFACISIFNCVLVYHDIYRISSNTAAVLNWTWVNFSIEIEKFMFF